MFKKMGKFSFFAFTLIFPTHRGQFAVQCFWSFWVLLAVFANKRTFIKEEYFYCFLLRKIWRNTHNLNLLPSFNPLLPV